MNEHKDAIDAEVVSKTSVYRERLLERKALITKTLSDIPQEESFKGDNVLTHFLEFYTGNEKRRISDTLTSTMSLKQDTIALLQEKQIAIRHLKLFIENIGTQTEEMQEELEYIEETLLSMDNGSFDESVLENLDLGV